MGINELRQIRESRDTPKEKKVYKIPPISKKKQAEADRATIARANEKTLSPAVKGSAELNRWFEERHKEMTGLCWHCQCRSSKYSKTYWKFSIAHILPKKIFNSVATHPLNWIELCFFGNSCHTNFDQFMLDIMDLNCFDLVIKRFVAMYPDIAPKERRHIPEVLLQYVEVEK